MKTITIFLLALVLNNSCDGQTKRDLKNTVIEYSARTRGFSQVIVVKNQEISIDTDSRGAKTSQAGKISDADWKILITEFQKLKLDQMKDLVAPSSKRSNDAAAIGQLSVKYKDTMHNSNSFDNGNPPKAISKFVNKITAIAKAIQKKQ